MINEIITNSQERMLKSVDALKSTLSKIRAGRAHPSLLEQIQVDYYNTSVPISQVATINSEDARTLKVTVWEKEMVSVIEKAIISSDLGLNPNSAGTVIRIPLPPLTEERRKDLIRIVKDEGEKAKVAVRHIRRDSNDDCKELLKEKKISKDHLHEGEERVQTLTNRYIEEIDKIINEKEHSLLDI